MAKIKPRDAWTHGQRNNARAILLEPSPYESDGGERIGRDPRKVSSGDWERAGIEGQPLLRVIRAKCLDCVGEQEVEVRKCVAVACPNWPYRMGENPFRAAREMTDEQRAALGERLARSRAARESSALKISSENSSDAPEGQG